MESDKETAPSNPVAEAGARRRPLCVDLDGTLCRCDTLWDLLAAVLRRNPWRLLRETGAFAWHRNRARWKARLAEGVALDADGFPWNRSVLDFARREHASGRRVVLATASTRAMADAVARALGCFGEVIASGPDSNLKGTRKADALTARFGSRGFDYIGDSLADLPVWKVSGTAWLVTPADQAPERIRRIIPDIRLLKIDGAPGAGAFVALLRPHQWVKNLLVFLPILTAHAWSVEAHWLHAALALASLSLAASAVYCLNDVLDAPEDRLHPDKRSRPVASGRVSIPSALVTGLAAGLLAWLPALALPPLFALTLASYFLLALLYVAIIKRLAWADIAALGAFYVLRLLAGGEATGIGCSLWLLGFAILLFPSLAMIKRASELALVAAARSSGLPGRAYGPRHSDSLRRLGWVFSILTFALIVGYALSPQAAAQYAAPHWLVGSGLGVFLWDRALWARAMRGRVSGDPVVCALKYPMSYLCLVMTAGCAILAL